MRFRSFDPQIITIPHVVFFWVLSKFVILDVCLFVALFVLGFLFNIYILLLDIETNFTSKLM